MVDWSDISNALSSHRRSRWWPWFCRCGAPYPCGPRIVALDERLRLATREVVDWYPRYFADLPPGEPTRMIPVAKLRDPSLWASLNPSPPTLGGGGHGDL